ncbi:hypothetical protein J437_LFUL009331 [Ladona fulva]|uniref:Retinol dehydrogenase 13 n=1 Tax=Ladona fulva TaxID=123851 RepID=A0A8K0K4Z7_LADFU|nr:hypothetical protein J437_LFUL009331 [Ladona fulva]
MDNPFPQDPLTSSWWPYIIGLVVAVVTCIRSYMGGQDCPTAERIDGKRVIITGSSSGMGYQTALQLASRGGEIMLACRDMTGANTAAKRITRKVKDAKIIVKKIDLSSLHSIHQFVETLDWESVDILINNAGIAFCPFEKTEEGFEQHFVSNYLGHFLLTHLLLPKLEAAPNARVINVSSQAHMAGDINLSDLNRETNYTAREAFGQSKLALVLMAREMAKRMKGSTVTVNALNPGLVRSTRHMRRSPLSSSIIIKFAVYPWMWLLMKNPAQGAQTSIYLSVAPELSDVTGRYFSDCQAVDPSQCAQDENLAADLYEKSCQLVNIKPLPKSKSE